MSNKMIERVAMSMFKIPELEDHGVMDVVSFSTFRIMAKAAIEAMREPTDYMIGSAGIVKDGEFVKAWKAMIDAALK